MSIRILLITLLGLLTSCSSGDRSVPRPHQYPRINFPEKNYQTYINEDCPFIMEVPQYAVIEQKNFLFEKIPAGKCWFDVNYPLFNAKIHCSYYNINAENKFDVLVDDAFTLASKHNIKASFRKEIYIENKNGATGLIFDISGPVATPFQFFLTDSTTHFLRGSLYFNDHIVTDSVAPIVDFLKKDIDVMLASLKWL